MKERIDRIYLPDGDIHLVPKSARQVMEEFLPEDKVIETPTERIPVSWRRNFDRIQEIQNAWREVYPFVDEITVNLQSEYPDLPHMVVWMADPHIGAIGQSEKLGKHINEVLVMPNTSMVGMGDIADFGVLPKFEVRWLQGLPVPLQMHTVKDMMEELCIPERNPKGRQILLAEVAGNHTATLFEQSGVLWEQFFSDTLNLPMFPGMGKINFRCGNQEYPVGLAHRYWGNSRLNKTLSCKRLLEYVYPDADETVVAHQHWKAMEAHWRGGKRVVGQRPGSYRTEMQYFEKMRGYYEGGNEGASCALFYPDAHFIEPFDDVERGFIRMAELCELDDYRKGHK